MTIQLSGQWLHGDTPDGGSAAVYASTVVAVREEPVGEQDEFGTWATTAQGVAVLFAGKQANAIYQLLTNTATGV